VLSEDNRVGAVLKSVLLSNQHAIARPSEAMKKTVNIWVTLDIRCASDIRILDLTDGFIKSHACLCVL
jgi:hypothetical protein